MKIVEKSQSIDAVLDIAGADLRGMTQLVFPIGQNVLTKNGNPRHVLILGGSLLQMPAIRMARQEGWIVILADGNENPLGRPYADHFEHIDLKDKEAMLAMARKYHSNGQLHGVFTAATDFSTTVAWVTEALGLPGISYEVALNASSKIRMRTLFQQNNIPSPHFVQISADQPPNHSAIKRLSLPVVVKPVDNMGARGVQKLITWEKLDEAISVALSFSRQGTILVEEFIEGPEYSIDSLIVNGKLVPCGIAQRHVQFAPNFVEVGHTLSSELTEAQSAELVSVFSKAVAVLGIVNGAAKGDVFFSAHGPVIGEIAARLSGGYMSGWTFPYASGIELTRAALYLAMDLPVPPLDPPQRLFSAERAIIPIPGTIESFEGTDTARESQGVRALFMRHLSGDTCLFPRNNVEKSGNVIAVDSDRETAMHMAEYAVSCVVLRLRANNSQTDAFLFRPERDQVRAYPRLADAIEMMVASSSLSSSIYTAHSFEKTFQIRDIFFDWPDTILEEQDWSWRSFHATQSYLLGKGYLKANLKQIAWTPLDSLFLKAIAHGGLTGALYVIDTLRQLPPKQVQPWISAALGSATR